MFLPTPKFPRVILLACTLDLRKPQLVTTRRILGIVKNANTLSKNRLPLNITVGFLSLSKEHVDQNMLIHLRLHNALAERSNFSI